MVSRLCPISIDNLDLVWTMRKKCGDCLLVLAADASIQAGRCFYKNNLTMAMRLFYVYGHVEVNVVILYVSAVWVGLSAPFTIHSLQTRCIILHTP